MNNQFQVNMQPAQQQPPPKKKNRTLQFYKFLLNAIKIEISLNEFLKLVKFSNFGEIFIWLLSVIIYFSGNQSYPLVWLHLAHVFRGIVGIVISNRLPRSYELIEQIDINGPEMETKMYNDVIRQAVRQSVVPRVNALKGFLLGYFALTFVNFMIDVVDFLYIISKVSDNDELDTVVFLGIVFVYLSKIVFNL
jgi:hypothetical protein